jgi:fatty acid desaturase
VTPRPISFYADQIRPALPRHAFEPVPARVAWVCVHLAIIAAATATLALHLVTGWLRWPLALLIGHSFAGLAFVGHEALHGAVVKGRKQIHALGLLCFLPFTVSPRLWIAWHNKVHHGNTMNPEVDPDAYPTLGQYRARRVLRVVDRYSLGRGQWFGWTTLILGFTVQHLQILFGASRRPRYLSPPQWRWALAETLAGLALWGALAVGLGPGVFLFAYAIPLMVGNIIVMSYILTNHSLSPLTPEVNDPLLNSLSVLVPAPIAAAHLNFGHHVEHHLFPTLSSRYTGLVRDELLERWPGRYQSMSLVRALWQLVRTPRVYMNDTTLIQPGTGREFPTLQPTLEAEPGAESPTLRSLG